MSLRINHNLAALDAHRNLTMTNHAMGKSMERLSSGYRINRGADDPAGLVISEQFRAQIAGLNRAISNSEGSISMIQTAEGALTEINSLLVSMRELAIHAANEGFNDADQLAADQAEIDNAIATIDRIAANTQFGTKKLIDGGNSNTATIVTQGNSGLRISESYLSDGDHSVTATQVADATASINSEALGLSLKNADGDPSNLSEKIHDLTVTQASDGARIRSGEIQWFDAFGNDLQLRAAATQATISTGDGTAAAIAAGTAGTYTFVLNYQENGEAPVGAQSIEVSLAAGDAVADVVSKLNAQINQNTALQGKVQAQAGGGTDDIGFTAVKSGANYSLKLNSISTTGTASNYAVDGTTQTARGHSLNTLDLTADFNSTSQAGAMTLTIAANTYNNVADLVNALTTSLNASFGQTTADATDNVKVQAVGDNQLEFFTVDEGREYSLQFTETGTGVQDAQWVLNINPNDVAVTGTSALVELDGYVNEITAVNWGETRDATLYNGDTSKASTGSANFVVGKALEGLNIGNLLLDVKAAKFDVRVDGGPAQLVTAGAETIVYNADRSESLKVKYDLDSVGGAERINNVDRSLVFQIGANVGQTAAIGLRNMAASALGTGLNLEGNLFRSLSEIDVTSVEGAQAAQQVIDKAINEVSTTRGTLGSFQKNTLESNLRNLRIAEQNLTASESMIRDTDMAKEMSEFTRNQILVQAGTSMLAQANQSPQIVLSLFQ